MSARKIRRSGGARGLLRETQGLTTIEYVIILCLIAIAGYVTWDQFGQSAKEKSQESATTVGGLPTN